MPENKKTVDIDTSGPGAEVELDVKQPESTDIEVSNDKDGITVSNKGVVKRYTNMGINENMDEMELDMIGDGSMDLEVGVFDEEMMEEDEMDIDLEKDGENFDIDVDFYDE